MHTVFFPLELLLKYPKQKTRFLKTLKNFLGVTILFSKGAEWLTRFFVLQYKYLTAQFLTNLRLRFPMYVRFFYSVF